MRRRWALAALLCMVSAVVMAQAGDEARLDKSREAGLLTDWHLMGPFGGHRAEFARAWAPEREAARHAGERAAKSYELSFVDGDFSLPAEKRVLAGIYYAASSTYLIGSGEWNVYLESAGRAEVFVDGRRVLDCAEQTRATRRASVRLASGYHAVLVKFTAGAAPFRVAILPLSSGSRRKNSMPYQPSEAAEELMLARR